MSFERLFSKASGGTELQTAKEYNRKRVLNQMVLRLSCYREVLHYNELGCCGSKWRLCVWITNEGVRRDINNGIQNIFLGLVQNETHILADNLSKAENETDVHFWIFFLFSRFCGGKGFLEAPAFFCVPLLTLLFFCFVDPAFKWFQDRCCWGISSCWWIIIYFKKEQQQSQQQTAVGIEWN